MKTYKVLASQLVYYTKTVQANTKEEAENLAWEDDTGDDWKDTAFGDWELENVQEVIQ